jgi:hypothetical protein
VLRDVAYATPTYDITPDVLNKLGTAAPKPAADAKKPKK